ncbi:NAD-glutamate dehydrogenase [Neoehrlichia mikurensis]|uniref:NAD-glutamate dehydrogenase n=1 Tax=Neoehrlichia mikurensis TaxID=89586 RepID=A0A9Q9BWN6_9RICK|nr:NAD-glutamate dehydrogenase domain-containing protein [Neoehrlichia mikurensis]QXK92060.1 NAD-glutamate dehydrogenase [Neoehrlichia mikurensis]QXK92517.1 NAD-glutamate dehydrogenase [Neoehrlichia mikurensis]UTO55276.1 NAD-glutamate dehydrogenase [Neoehrlichia mikurensis]UTO56196.1 NAD-glutamate dehydrogenase [Neoehrlichia mikurensis]
MRSNNYSFNNKVIDSMLLLLEQDNSNSHNLLKNFIKKFYNFSYSSDVELSINFLLYSVKDLFDFIKERAKNESKVRIFNINNKDIIQENLTIIETINNNIPFIIDSIIIILKKYNLSIYHYTNAVLNIKRENDVIVDILKTQSCANDKTNESIAYFIVNTIDKNTQAILKSDIKKTLTAVHQCVQDWHLMLDHINVILNNLKTNNSHQEICQFLKWIQNDNFVFLGYEEYVAKNEKLVITNSSSLGLQKINATSQPIKNIPDSKSHLYIIQSDIISHVHRHEYMICIGIRTFSNTGVLLKEECFYGFFASVVSFQDAIHIPIIREKIQAVELKSGFIKKGHNNKALIAILQRFSREELFQFSEEELFQISMGILFLSSNPKIKLFIRRDISNNFINCIIFVPKNFASTESATKMSNILENMLLGKVVTQYYSMCNESDLVRLQFMLKISDNLPNVSEQEIEAQLIESTKRWEDRLYNVLYNKCGYDFSQYLNAFPVSYQEYFDPESAYHDIIKINKALQHNTSEVDLYLAENNNHYQLKVYIPEQENLKLSKVLNIVRKMGVNILLHYSYNIAIQGNSICLHHFILSNTKESLNYNSIKKQFEITLKKIFSKEIENDLFNNLVISANLNWKEVLLIRLLSKYLKQISFSYSQSYIRKILIKYPDIIYLFIRLFEIRFDPNLNTLRKEHEAIIREKIKQLFTNVIDIVHDYILQCIYSLILAVLRTNYYQGDKSYLSIKIDSSKVPNIPLPCPFREIYVYSSMFEAIHLRGGKVARGGIRWSDRIEDFRTEVLGLMKAQMTKNSVIVPVGSKGGFILKNPAKDKPLIDYAIECYKNFLRGILDITDNIIDDKYITPDNVIKYDEYDPYLVVAADKGTASFSDYANQISQEYNFWLRDAFASGGSIGFDHKKMGITAKGAWIAANRHFWIIDKNIQEEIFTVIGIGDMSGDVFGNGMLLSNKICLLGAFNHLHIFIDPSPNPEKSFLERQRLFSIPGSSWEDYNRSIISKGGGVFCRKSKSITLTPEMKERFHINKDQKEISPDNLITYLLKAPVDMIWNGGIGTYIKSSKESNAVVADKANDNLRINGCDVKASMIIEGGNLGCTQLGRIEYSNTGGRINTDFIDNAGGVICSDFETNIKICLELAVKDKFISFDKRNIILDSIISDIPAIVLNHHNKLETKVLMLECMQSQERIDQHHKLLQHLEKIKMLDRNIEFLPSDEEITKMSSEKRGFNAPQIAVLIAYTRMCIKNEIMSSDLLQHSTNFINLYESQYLLSYFPPYIRNNFEKYIKQHTLKKEILATCISNDIVNRMGCVFVHHIESMGITVDNVIRVYIIITYIYNISEIWDELDKIDSNISIDSYVTIVREVQKFIGQATFWFFRNLHKFVDIEKKLDDLSSKIVLLEKNMTDIICSKLKTKDSNTLYNNIPQENGINPKVIKKINNLKFLISGLDIIYLAENTNIPIVIVGKIYFHLKSVLNFNRIRELALQMDSSSSYWQRIAIRNLLDDLSDYQSIITGNIIKHIEPLIINNNNQSNTEVIVNNSITSWCVQHQSQLNRYYSFLNEINTTQLELSKLMLIIKSLSVFTLEKDYNV